MTELGKYAFVQSRHLKSIADTDITGRKARSRTPPQLELNAMLRNYYMQLIKKIYEGLLPSKLNYSSTLFPLNKRIYQTHLLHQEYIELSVHRSYSTTTFIEP